MMKKIRIIEGYTRDLGIPEAWWEGEVYNAARPFPSHEDKIGEFIHGVFYGVIYPNRDFAGEYRKRAIALDAHRMVQVSRETVEDWGRAYCEEHGIQREVGYDEIVRSFLNLTG